MPEAYDKAALRHFLDAEMLGKEKRYDNAGHLIGFAAECAIKYAFSLVEPTDASPRVHLPDLANAVLKLIKRRKPHQVALRNLLISTQRGFFDDWRVAARYDPDGNVDSETFKKWRVLAQRAMGAAGLKQ